VHRQGNERTCLEALEKNVFAYYSIGNVPKGHDSIAMPIWDSSVKHNNPHRDITSAWQAVASALHFDFIHPCTTTAQSQPELTIATGRLYEQFCIGKLYGW
jgi:hypothetical protein